MRYMDHQLKKKLKHADLTLASIVTTRILITPINVMHCTAPHDSAELFVGTSIFAAQTYEPIHKHL